MILLLLLSGPALLALSLTIVNLLAVARPRAEEGGSVHDVSVLVPARDEEREIGDCLDALLAEPVGQVLVYDDLSSDRTAAIVLARAAVDSRVRLLRGGPLPAGWAGKPHACAALASAARLPLLLFVDADVRMERGGVAALLRTMRESGADAVTAVPRQETVTLAERLLVPLLHVVYFGLAPLWLMPKTRDSRVCAANGQLLLFAAAAYARSGGHAHSRVRAAVVEDQAICVEAKRAGLRVVFADAHLAARCRMYRGAGEVWRGFGKSLYAGVGGTPLKLLGACALLAWVLLAPLAALPFAPEAAWPGAVALLTLRVALAGRSGRSPLEAALLHVPGVLALLAVAAGSWARARAGGVVWRGRRYGGNEGVGEAG